MLLIWIALGGGLGSVLRYLMVTRVDQWYAGGFPVGVLSVNALGSFLIGLVALQLTQQSYLQAELRTSLLVGLLGGFTTFSTFSYNSLQLILEGEYLSALLNVVLSVVVCIMAAGAGLMLAKSFSI
ncbi:MAG: fluoride efflux transporter CrcB [Gammaproteobacteria bacterium]|nr:fluoride efflux transporter CrcB [Gammaproteobacteria bacterium]